MLSIDYFIKYIHPSEETLLIIGVKIFLGYNLISGGLFEAVSIDLAYYVMNFKCN